MDFEIEAPLDVRTQLAAHQELLNALTEEPYPELVATLSQRIVEAYRAGKKVILMGNGGSAADAQHVAAEMVARFKLERPAWPALALHANTSTITAIGNDYSYDEIYVRQVEAFVDRGDVVIGISTSGNSENIVRALYSARERGAWTVAFTGKGGGRVAKVADLLMAMPSGDTPRVQEGHITLLHIVCDLVERALVEGSVE